MPFFCKTCPSCGEKVHIRKNKCECGHTFRSKRKLTIRERRANDKIRQRIKRDKETSEEREARKATDRIRQRIKRENETAEERKAHQRSNKIRQRIKRAKVKETSEEREARRATDRIRQKIKRDKATAKEREAHRAASRIYQRVKRSKETAEEKEARRAADRIRQRIKRENETADERKARQLANRIRQRIKRAKAIEIADKKEVHRATDQIRQRIKRENETVDEREANQLANRVPQRIKKIKAKETAHEGDTCTSIATNSIQRLKETANEQNGCKVGIQYRAWSAIDKKTANSKNAANTIQRHEETADVRNIQKVVSRIHHGLCRARAEKAIHEKKACRVADRSKHRIQKARAIYREETCIRTANKIQNYERSTCQISNKSLSKVANKQYTRKLPDKVQHGVYVSRSIGSNKTADSSKTIQRGIETVSTGRLVQRRIVALPGNVKPCAPTATAVVTTEIGTGVSSRSRQLLVDNVAVNKVLSADKRTISQLTSSLEEVQLLTPPVLGPTTINTSSTYTISSSKPPHKIIALTVPTQIQPLPPLYDITSTKTGTIQVSTISSPTGNLAPSIDKMTDKQYMKLPSNGFSLRHTHNRRAFSKQLEQKILVAPYPKKFQQIWPIIPSRDSSFVANFGLEGVVEHFRYNLKPQTPKVPSKVKPVCNQCNCDFASAWQIQKGNSKQLLLCESCHFQNLKILQCSKLSNQLKDLLESVKKEEEQFSKESEVSGIGNSKKEL